MASGSQAIKRLLFNINGWRQFGLRYDDLLDETPVVKEAVRRLPAKEYHERSYRIIRAMQYSLMHRILPKEQWTKFEEDIPYLQPYIDDIKKEIKEKEEWEKNH
ncbi:cytochrome b-c1 complex subunit 7-like [Centruroides sculpturatus]|uniref:cytochrome b-c1 complex subunit 7-like n=1 Tax=Centruroides sculpturatus TaxID=218467 RepID=UPI000C6EDB40|nr:cytochrome b-c1 complex subunit 7-like [Centruroides sculpturatus]